VSDVLDRMVASMRAAFRPIGEWHEREGTGAVVTLGVPERSVVNCVLYEPGADLAATYDWLESLYVDVDAWTVWVHPGDEATATLLAGLGHRLDADPAAMVLDLADLRPPTALPVWQPGTVEQLGRMNEAAYGYGDGSMERALLGSRYGDDLRIYVAEESAALGIVDDAGDASAVFVATLPEARGRGLATGLLAAALIEARERGNEISTLQATKAGEPVYTRLGYRSIGPMQMWEKRKR
jgi:GNAT superfamily N-acetyltransferase